MKNVKKMTFQMLEVVITKRVIGTSGEFDLDGQKNILNITIGESESSKFWLKEIDNLRSRGVLKILLLLQLMVYQDLKKLLTQYSQKLKFKGVLYIKLEIL